MQKELALVATAHKLANVIDEEQSSVIEGTKNVLSNKKHDWNTMLVAVAPPPKYLWGRRSNVLQRATSGAATVLPICMVH